MQDIKTILELIKTDSSVMDVERDGLSLVSLLLEIAEADIESEDGRQAVETIERIRNANNCCYVFEKACIGWDGCIFS